MDKYAYLRHYYGYEAFRPGQETLIDGILAGRDAFGVMPTGGGKSICYQLPGMMLPGITLVVSPLISLMKDQVMALKASGIPAAFINSTLSGPQMQMVYRNLLAGKYKIVYVAPERLDYPGFGTVAAKLQISLIAVDEAHCISQWGQDFRPSYLRIVQFIDQLPVRPVVAAYTATATAQVREDVERILCLKDPVRVLTGFDRPNLSFTVTCPEDRDKELLRLLKTRRDKCGIVYCATRKNVENICDLLNDNGIAATRYHAGLEESERSGNQEDFIHDRRTVMVATNAFGMGIDKSNVSFVIHYNMPKSIEAYYQEAGRAGRDGTEAECILLFRQKDVELARFLIENSSDNEELDEEQKRIVRRQDLDRLDAMVRYCNTRECLRGYILEYFGQDHVMNCGNCGNCIGEFEKRDITREAQMILSCVIRVEEKLGYPLGVATVAKVLQGNREKKLLELGLHELSTFGIMNTTGRTEIRSMATRLEEEGYLLTDLEHRGITVTPKANEILFRGERIWMLVPKEEEAAPKSVRKKDAVVVEELDQELFEELRILRGEIAKREHMAAYTVFSNATLADMASKKPTNLTQFKKVSGVGELKASWYGKTFVEKIKEYLREHS